MSKTFSPGLSSAFFAVLVAILIGSLGYAWVVRRSLSGTAGDRPRVLKLGHGLPTEHPVHAAMQYMADRVRELSGGSLEIGIYPSGMIGSEAECLKQVQNGQIDLAKTSSAVLESSVPEMVALGMPYLFRDDDHYWKVLLGPIGRELGELPKGMRALTYYDSGRRSLYTVKKPVHTPDDVRGLKVRTQQSRCAMDMILALGGAPTPIPWGELYTALSQGTVDGAENNLPSFDTGRHLEVCRYFIMTEHSQVPDMLMISRATWESLSPEQRRWLEQAAAESTVKQRELWKEAETTARAKSLEQGVKFIEVDKKAFAEKTRPMYEKQPPEVKAFIEKIREVE